MLAERLAEFAEALKADYAKTKIVSLLAQLRQSLNNQASNPNHPPFQSNVADIRSQIEKALKSSATNSFPPSWRRMLGDAALEGYFGAGLLRRFTDIFSRNNMTMANAVAEVQKLEEDITKSSNNIDGLLSGLSWFEINGDMLASGQFEIDVTIPRGRP